MIVDKVLEEEEEEEEEEATELTLIVDQVMVEEVISVLIY